MEKITGKPKRIFRARLLIFAFFLLFIAALPPLVAAPFDRSGGYEARPQESRFFVGQDCGFVLEIPNAAPSVVQMEIPDTPSDVRFLTFKKDEYIDEEGSHGTKIQAWFMFSSPTEQGRQTVLPPFKVKVKNRQYIVPVAPVTVYDVPERLFPELRVLFDGSKNGDAVFVGADSVVVKAGESVHLSLYVRYCTQLLRFSWDLPKNAIFTETERYNIARGEPQGKAFSPDWIPVARFVWTPLVAGEYSLPPISVEAVAYNGSRRTIVPAAKKLVVQEAAQTQSVSEQKNPFFADAFWSDENLVPAESAVAITSEQCRHLAELRSAERNSFPFSRTRTERKAYESQLGFSDVPSEPSKPLPHVLLAISVACALIATALFLSRHTRMMIPPILAAILFLIASIWVYATCVASYAIFSGGEMSQVPEEKFSSSVTVTGGIRVRVMEKAGEWVYIVGTDVAGWVKNDTLWIIE